MATWSRPGASAVRERPDERLYRFTNDNIADPGFGPTGWSRESAADHARIVVTPIAAPSILGLFGFFAAALPFSTHLAGWWGTPATPVLFFPFAMMLGGVAQFIAGMWAYRAREGLATAIHGVWGGFWLAFGLYELLVSTGNLPLQGVHDPSYGSWFIPLAAITAVGTLASLAVSVGLFAFLLPLTVASAFAAAGWMSGTSWPLTTAGWFFFVSAIAAWYVASAMLLNSMFGRPVLPTGDTAGELDAAERSGDPAAYERTRTAPAQGGRTGP